MPAKKPPAKKALVLDRLSKVRGFRPLNRLRATGIGQKMGLKDRRITEQRRKKPFDVDVTEYIIPGSHIGALEFSPTAQTKKTTIQDLSGKKRRKFKGKRVKITDKQKMEKDSFFPIGSVKKYRAKAATDRRKKESK